MSSTFVFYKKHVYVFSKERHMIAKPQIEGKVHKSGCILPIVCLVALAER